MRRPIIGLLLFVVVAAGGSFYLLGRKSVAPASESRKTTLATATVPAQEVSTPHASTLSAAELPPPAIASDKSGTSAELRRILKCHELLATRNAIQRTICDDIVGDANANEERCHTEMAKVNLELQEQEAKSGICPERLAAPSEYYAALRELALQGNPNAQRCFILGYFGESGEERLLLTQAQYDEHPVLARKFIKAGFERGDWSLVHVLARTQMGFPGDSNLFNAWPHGFSTPESAENTYKMNYLLLLGNRPEEFESNDPGRLIDHWRKNPDLLQLTNDQLDEAEAWAKDMYRHHFAGGQEAGSSAGTKFCSAD
jgi:hypothetical protein